MQDSHTKSTGKVGTTEIYEDRGQQKQRIACASARKIIKITTELRKSGYRRRILQLTPARVDNLLVFRGICGQHDTELFKILDQGFQPGNHEHAFTQAYRTALYQDYIYWREAERINRLRVQRGQKRIEDGGLDATFTELELRVIISAGCARILRAQMGKWMRERLYEKVAYRQVCFDHPGPAVAGACVMRAGARGQPGMDSVNLTVIPVERTKTIVNAVMPQRSERILDAVFEDLLDGNSTEQKQRLSTVMLRSFPDFAIAAQLWNKQNNAWKEMVWKSRVVHLTGDYDGPPDTDINFFE